MVKDIYFRDGEKAVSRADKRADRDQARAKHGGKATVKKNISKKDADQIRRAKMQNRKHRVAERREEMAQKTSL